MTDAALARSALETGRRAGHDGAEPSSTAGVTAVERRDLSMVQVAAFPQAAAEVAARLQSRLTIRMPERPNTSTAAGDVSALWVGPSRWLCVAPGSRDLIGAVAGTLDAGQAAVTDLSHARTVIRLTGPQARDVLAKGCSLDFHPREFPAGACASSTIAHIGGLIHAVDASAVDVFVARSYALHFWEWLTEAAAEFGLRAGS